MRRPPADPRSFHVPVVGPTVAPTDGGATPGTGAPRRRRRMVRVAAALFAVGALLVVYLAGSAWWTWRGVERIELGSALAGADSGTNYLVVGTDSRAGVATDVDNAGVIFGVEGERTDTIAVLHVDGGQVALLAVPRDLWVPLEGRQRRINAAYAVGGPALLVDAVQRELGIGIDHLLEVDFAGFLSLVDALGTVTVEFEHPARDTNSGLSIDRAGPVDLDATQALAYVRSRHYVEIVDGVAVADPRADLGRVQRQQKFLAAVFDELGAARNPFRLLDALRGVAANVRVDDGMGLGDVVSLGLTLRGADPVTATVPTSRHITDGGADVLLLDRAAAPEVLAPFR